MLERKARPGDGPMAIGAYEAKTKFSELIGRAERGESFVVTKNGRPVARLVPVEEQEQEQARQAGERIMARLAAQGPPVSEEETQRNWEELKRELDDEDDTQLDEWLSSSTPR
jgi:prevent-host-death family protein